MVSAIAIIVIALPLYVFYSSYTSLQRNILAAKLSGLPYVVSPIHLYNRFWLVTHRIWLPLLHRLPKSWTGDWLELINPDWCWQERYEPFAKHGDTFITVSPARLIVWTSQPEVIHQVTQRRDAFPKPLESYAILEVYGRNVITTEGMDWKKHRKVTSPGFNEKNNALVFKESIAQAQGMLRKWTGSEGKGNFTLNEIPMDSMRVTLHIISKIGFGVGLLWPGEAPKERDKSAGVKYSSNEPTEGFTMSFEHALSSLLENLIWVLLFPGWLLKRLPVAAAKEAYESYVNWGKYMKAIYDQKMAEAKTGEHSEGMDIMGSLVRSTLTDQKASSKLKESPSGAERGQVGQAPLSESDILGNAFVLIIAGHETTANSVHFALIMLAMNPDSQRRLQKEIESIFGSHPPEEWDYDQSINACLGGMLGAVLNEELRLMPPVINIPKSVRPDQDQTVTIEGKRVVLPRGSFVNINTVGVQRNPNYWPSRGRSKISDAPNDLDDFIPERWLVKEGSRSNFDTPDQSDSEKEDFGGFTGQDTAAQLFRPVRGSFVPFSDGARSCLGRRLAQVEVVGVFSVIFQNYSVELAVDEWASDEEVSKMTDQEKVLLYSKAQQKAARILKGASTRITLKLHDGDTFIPVRVVRKGEERFTHLID